MSVMIILPIAERLMICLLLYHLFDFSQRKLKLQISPSVSLPFAAALTLLTTSHSVRVLAICLLLISEVDRQERRIPDIFTKPAICLLASIYLERTEAIIISAGWMMLMYGLTYLAPEVIGRGDIKFIAALIMLNEHFQATNPANFLMLLLFISSLLGLPGAVLTRRKGDTYPFAPAISAAALVIFL